MLTEMLRTLYRTEGKVDSLNERVNRLEDRQQQRPRGLSPADLLPYLPGLIVLGLVALGKMSLSEAVQQLKSGP